jgi:hypothetical protein
MEHLWDIYGISCLLHGIKLAVGSWEYSGKGENGVQLVGIDLGLDRHVLQGMNASRLVGS